MQLSEFTYIFLALCVPFFAYIVKSTEPKKGFSILFSTVIAMNIFLYMDKFSYLGAVFLVIYLNLFKKVEKQYLLILSFISFTIGAYGLVGESLFKATLPIMMVSSVFSLMMIGHWFLVDPTIKREGMKNIALFSTYLSVGISILVFFGLYENSSSLFNLISINMLNNIIIFLYISSALLSFGSYKSLQEKSYTGVMASTGLSYLSLIVSMGASGTLILSI
tara:strand:+ start:3298 stop:3960 length:663 start_codon:yes stop_codon:yes gene_type:complete